MILLNHRSDLSLIHLNHHHEGMNSLPKKQELKSSILKEKTIGIAKSLYKKSEQPDKDYKKFIPQAEKILKESIQ